MIYFFKVTNNILRIDISRIMSLLKYKMQDLFFKTVLNKYRRELLYPLK